MTDIELAAAVWRKSRRSNGQANCVEVATNLSGIVAIRDSKDPDGGALAIIKEEWRRFVQRVASGDI